MQVFNLGYDNFLGRLAIGRIYDGKIKIGQIVFAKNPDGKSHTGKITKLFTFEGIAKKETHLKQLRRHCHDCRHS
jgi:GTP-binding protein